MLFTDGMSTPMGFHFFGGWKVSLCGDHHVHGRGSACFYIKLKMATAPQAHWPPCANAEFMLPTTS